MPDKKTLVFKNAKIITPMRVIDNGVLIVDQGKIFDLGPGNEIKIPKNRKVIDVDGKYLAPGFIDIHLHGGGGADTMDATEEAMEKMSVAHAKGGATSIVPTTTSAPMDDIIRAVKVIELAKKRTLPGAQVLGAHIEGPYFSMEQKGAQNPEYLKNPKPEEYLELLDEYDCILRISAAPELEGGLKLGRELKKRGIVASIAHTGNYVAKLLSRDSFAGSVATMDRCVRNIVKLVGLSIQDALKMATLNPAKIIGVDKKKGSLTKGKDADMVILGKDVNVIMTIVGGIIVYRK